jgi:hypothetical protein
MTTTLRLTRRGRIALGILLAIPAVTLSMLLVSPGALAGDEFIENDFEYHTVLSGDTLWGIAAIIDPGADPRDVVEQIMTLNGLTNAAVSPGQQLALPR